MGTLTSQEEIFIKLHEFLIKDKKTKDVPQIVSYILYTLKINSVNIHTYHKIHCWYYITM